MVAINFNATTVDPTTGGTDIFETGDYGFIITGSSTKPTKKNDGTILQFDCKCTDEGQAGKMTAIRLNIQNPNAQTVEIAFRDLSAICHVVGVLHMTDTMQLHGRPFRMRLEKQPRSDKPELFENAIRGYLDANGQPPKAGTPAGAGAGAPAAPQPPAPPAAAPAPVAPPAPAPVAPPAPAPAPAPATAPEPAPVAPVAAPPVASPIEQPAAAAPAPAPAPVAPPAPVYEAPAPVAPVAGATPPWQQ